MSKKSLTIGRSSNFLTLTLRITLDDEMTLERQTTPFAVLATRAAASDMTETLGTADLSTLAEGHESRDRENQILRRIAQNMPVDMSKGWYNLLGSPHHHGSYGENAVDLNYGSAGDDVDAVIRAVDAGTISRIYRDGAVTILVITHELQEGATWDSVYMHMPMHDMGNGTWETVSSEGNVVATLKEGDAVSAGQTIGANGKEGSDGEHLHFEAHLGTWRSTAAINLDGMFRQMSTPIPTKVHAGVRNNYVVTFEAELQQWVHATERIVAHIATVDGHGEVQMLAWQDGVSLEEMERVVWDADQNAWFKWDMSQNNWATENGLRQKWSLVDGQHQFSPL